MITDKDIELSLIQHFIQTESEDIIGYDAEKFLKFIKFDIKKYKYWEPINKSAYLYKYYLLEPQETKIRSFTEDFKKIKYRNQLFLKYHPITNYFFISYEIYRKYNLIDTITSEDEILSVGKGLSFIEMFHYFKIPHKKLNFIHINTYKKLQDNTYDKFIQEDILPLLSKFAFNYNEFTDYIYEILKMPMKKQKIIDIKYSYFGKGNIPFCFQNSFQIFYIVIYLFAIKNLKKGGSIIINLRFNNKTIIDLYLIIKQYFKETFIFRPDIQNDFKLNFNIIYKGFKGIPKDDKIVEKLLNIVKKIQKIYPRDVDDFNVYDKKDREYWGITKPIEGKPKPFLNGLLNISKERKEILYEEVKNYNKQFYYNDYLKIVKTFKLLDIPETQLPTLPTPQQINYSILYCKKWGIEYNEFFNKDKNTIGELATQILNEMYGLHQPVIFDFKTPKQYYILPTPSLKSIKSKKIKTNKKSKRLHQFRKAIMKGGFKKSSKKKSSKKKSSKKISLYKTQRFNSVREALSYIELEDYKKFISESKVNAQIKIDISLIDELQEENIRYNQNKLSYESRFDIKKKRDMKTLSKFRSIREKFDYYSVKNKSKSSIPYILKNVMKNELIDLQWTIMFELLYELDIINSKSTSINLLYLSNKSSITYKNELNCIQYYLKKYRKNPILKYKISHPKKFKDVLKERENYMISVTANIQSLIINTSLSKNSQSIYSNLVNILHILPKQGSMIFKLELPIVHPSLMNLLYICYQYFGKFIIYKPIQEAYTNHFYLIGKDFQELPEELLSHLIYVSLNYNEIEGDSMDLFDDSYPKAFVMQLKYINKILVDKYAYIIDKQLYYFDNYKYLNKEFTELLPEFIKEKNIEWLKRYKIRK